jgi:hypothetical protein
MMRECRQALEAEDIPVKRVAEISSKVYPHISRQRSQTLCLSSGRKGMIDRVATRKTVLVDLGQWAMATGRRRLVHDVQAAMEREDLAHE